MPASGSRSARGRGSLPRPRQLHQSHSLGPPNWNFPAITRTPTKLSTFAWSSRCEPAKNGHRMRFVAKATVKEPVSPPFGAKADVSRIVIDSAKMHDRELKQKGS